MSSRLFPIGAVLLWAVLAAFGDGAENLCRVRVSTEPEGALIVCDGIVREAAPLVIDNLRPGKHVVTAKKQGYRDTSRTVILNAGQPAAVNIRLEEITGLLLVHTDPAGADVTIDGAHRGTTPLLITDLPLGKYRMRLAVSGYHPKELDVALNNRIPVKKEVSLKSDSAQLVVTSEPAGANVKVNGVVRGKSPCTVTGIQEGKTSLEVSLEGHAPYKSTLKLAAGEKHSVKAVLKPLPAVIEVFSIPRGARIYLDNQYRGKAPVKMAGLKPGPCRLRAEMPGFEPMARTVRLRSGQTAREEFRLSGNAGSLLLITVPPGAEVLVDGEKTGKTPPAKDDPTMSEPLKIGPLLPGDHPITIKKDGYENLTFTTTIDKNRTVTVKKELKRKFVVNYLVRTDDGKVYRGMLIETDQYGNVKLELRPGVYKTFGGAEIKVQHPIEPRRPR
ncbi:MAG: PEGA domain-containing protein [Kiritimatiellia bacterium]